MDSDLHSNHQPRVVVIGAGFAGLGAATTLVKHGVKNLIILEALDRAGGRVWTHKPFGADALELGATWIHGQKDNPLYQMSKEKGLLADDGFGMVSCQPLSVTPQDYFFNEQGKQLPPTQVEHVTCFFGRLMSQINQQDYKRECESWSVGEYLDREFTLSNLSKVEGAEEIYEWCKRAECVDEACNSMYEFSLSQLGLYTALEGPFFNSLGSKGYQAVLDIFIDQLPPNSLRCRKPVRCVQWDGSSSPSKLSKHPVNVVCEDGEQFPSDHVIVTVSLGCMKERASTFFDPPLPKGKMEAIQRLGFGTVAKIFLEFSKPFWPDDCAGIQLLWEQGPESLKGYSDGCRQQSWRSEWFKKIGGFDCVPMHRSTLCGWITGLAAEHMETLPESEVGEVCVRLLKQFTSWPVTELRGVLRSKWYSNPYIRGSYTNVPLGVDAVKEQMALAEPLPSTYQRKTQRPLQVLFAGEATHPNFYTTTHGAYMSGVREAERLIKLFESKAIPRL
ncbi:peroxisomal N(1)-acetyl-spermine/spermidine oxidase-like [Bufo gargarizans]|uniref:peroxisomal N(1)-acetyl-spermine/spermidine oxidase-like n=1 Tax=Bufo gargarizans TaxID=30331 RepID=UPI001CF2CA0C|nr:peroxisomal N(1)-acetyl-spermine/spermidine oxidase-like [Bufo gargarizans]XP_044160848.1 peroxisomal N(1)-acetyl-spermine/spermidine oxidase-like [Bufo gargarizans]